LCGASQSHYIRLALSAVRVSRIEYEIAMLRDPIEVVKVVRSQQCDALRASHCSLCELASKQRHAVDRDRFDIRIVELDMSAAPVEVLKNLDGG